MFERLLGDLYLSLTDYQKPLPSLLRDLLETEELDKYLGEDILFLIKSIIGPPSGLNLRNIIWHGFLSIKEYDTSFTSFLFMLFFTTLKHLSENNISKFKVRNLIDFKSEDPLDFGSGPFPFKRDDNFMKNLKKMLKTSYFQIPGREDMVLQAFEDHFNEKNLESACLILPQIEHAIRRIFVSIHEKLPQEMLMAQSRVLFTTMDIILQSVLEHNNDINLLIKEFGVEVMSFLNDIFIHSDGYRIRDKIAHGMVEKVDSLTTHKLLGIYLYLSLKYNIIQKWDYEPFNQCLNYYTKYQTIYHPKSRFLIEAYELYKSWTSIHNIPILELKEATEYECAWNDKIYNLRKLDKKDNSLNVNQIMEIFKKLNLEKGLFFEEKVDVENPIQHYINKGFLIEEYHLIESENRKEYLLCVNMKRKILGELKSTINNVMSNFSQI